LSKVTSDGLINPVLHSSCTYIATVGVKGLSYNKSVTEIGADKLGIVAASFLDGCLSSLLLLLLLVLE